MKTFLLILIRVYQLVFSGDTGALRPLVLTLSGNATGKVCRHSPVCSEYAYQMIVKYGAIKGMLLGLKRIWNCRP